MRSCALLCVDTMATLDKGTAAGGPGGAGESGGAGADGKAACAGKSTVYFGYGSNMSRTVMRTVKDVAECRVELAVLRGYRLVFDLHVLDFRADAYFAK